MEGGGGTNQQGGNVTNSRKTSKHRQTKRQATGCRPVDQGTRSTTNRTAQRPAEPQKTIRQAKTNRTAEKPAERPTEHHRPQIKLTDQTN